MESYGAVLKGRERYHIFLVADTPEFAEANSHYARDIPNLVVVRQHTRVTDLLATTTGNVFVMRARSLPLAGTDMPVFVSKVLRLLADPSIPNPFEPVPVLAPVPVPIPAPAPASISPEPVPAHASIAPEPEHATAPAPAPASIAPEPEYVPSPAPIAQLIPINVIEDMTKIRKGKGWRKKLEQEIVTQEAIRAEQAMRAEEAMKAEKAARAEKELLIAEYAAQLKARYELYCASQQ